MSPMDFEEQFSVALRTAAESVTPPSEELARAGELLGQTRRRRRTRSVASVGVGVLAVAVVATAVQLNRGPQSVHSVQPAGSTGAPTVASSAGSTPTSSAGTGAPPTGCPTPLSLAPLPTWAAGGFTDPTASGTPHAIGAQGKITAILFGKLRYPEDKEQGNKVLWVTRVTALTAPLVIDAQLDGTTETVRRQLDTGPGPSYLELPHTGCWHLSLTWDNGAQHDSLDLPFGSPN